MLKEQLPRTQEKLERACLEHHCERPLKLCDWSSIQVSLFLLTGEAGIVNDQCCGMHCYALCIGSWLDKVHWYRAMRHPQSFWKFAEISRKVSILIYLYRWAENQIYLEILFFTNTDNHRFFWLYSLIECLQVNRMYVTSFWFHSKLVLEKAKKPASYELPIHTFFNILHNFFQKRVLDIFKWTFWQTSFHQVLYSNKGVLCLRSFMSRKTSLLTSIPENFSPWLWL